MREIADLRLQIEKPLAPGAPFNLQSKLCILKLLSESAILISFP